MSQTRAELDHTALALQDQQDLAGDKAVLEKDSDHSVSQSTRDAGQFESPSMKDKQIIVVYDVLAIEGFEQWTVSLGPQGRSSLVALATGSSLSTRRPPSIAGLNDKSLKEEVLQESIFAPSDSETTLRLLLPKPGRPVFAAVGVFVRLNFLMLVI
jgi:hypothetical protein